MELLENHPKQAVNVYIPSPGPTIESDRLLLRPVQDSDVPGLFAIRSLPEVSKFNYPPIPFQTHEETRAWLKTKLFAVGPDDVLGRSFNYAMLDKSIPADQEPLIGYVSINTLDPVPEIGYSLLPGAWGKGFATEGLRLLLQMWWDLPRRDVVLDGPERVFAVCQQDNLGSCGVLRKCGFDVFADLEFEGVKLFIWSLERPTN